MKYMLVPQLSFRNAKGELDYDKDSNYVFNYNLLKSIAFNGHESIIILPQHYPKLFHNNPIYSRFMFDFEEAKKAVIDNNPDIILENDPCRVMCWNILRYQEKLRYTVYTYNHWLDTLIDPKLTDKYCTYMHRQFEGHEYSRKSFFNSNFAIEHFTNNYKRLFFTSHELINSKWIYKLPPFVDLDELNKYKENKKENIVVFNHRLSDIPYYKINVDNFLSLLKMSDELLDNKIIFTNPTSKNTDWLVNELRDMGANYEFVNLERPEYLDLISRSKIGFCLFEHPGMWSISALEMSYFTSVLGFDHSGYSELLHPECKFRELLEVSRSVGTHMSNPITNDEIVTSVDVKQNTYIKNFIS